MNQHLCDLGLQKEWSLRVHTTTVTRTVMNEIVGTTLRTIIWTLETQAAITIHLNLQDHQLFWFWAIFLQNNLARVLMKLVSNCSLPLLSELTAGIYQTVFGWSVLMTLSHSNNLLNTYVMYMTKIPFVFAAVLFDSCQNNWWWLIQTLV